MNTINETINFEVKAKSCRELDTRQLFAYLKSDIMRFFSWGACAFTVDNTKKVRMFRMKVNGHHHKGHVYIFLNGLDLFDVYLTSLKGVIKEIGTDLYFDQLAEWIDHKIEYIPEYGNN